MRERGKAPAFLLDVDDWLTSVRIAAMTPAEEAGYLRLLLYAWKDSLCSIPDDDQLLATLSRLGPSWLQGSCNVVRACFEPHPAIPGRLINKRLLHEHNKWQERIAGMSKGGKKSAAKRKKRQGIPSTLQGGSKLVDSTFDKNKSKDKGKSKVNGNGNDPPASQVYSNPLNCSEGGESERGEPMPSWMDDFYGRFRLTWNVQYPGQDYDDERKPADFVHLAKIQTNRALTPENWTVACAHYLASPRTTHTMADLAVHYSAFLANQFDRYNKPVRGNGHMTDKENRTIEAANRVIARLQSGEFNPSKSS